MRWNPASYRAPGAALGRWRFLPLQQVDRAAVEAAFAHEDPRVPPRPIEPERGTRLGVLGCRADTIGQAATIDVEGA